MIEASYTHARGASVDDYRKSIFAHKEKRKARFSLDDRLEPSTQ
jgi:hypothetical protein